MLKSILLPTVAVMALATPADAAVRNFFAPAIEGARLDACLTAGGECGKPVADAYCKAQGFEVAVLFQREPVLLSRRLGAGGMCEGNSCTSFRQIKCYMPNEVIAAAS